MMTRWMSFRPCPGCGYDITTGEGTRACRWGDCPYLPPELDVFCPNCRFNFFTRRGNPLCGRPGVCEQSAEARSNVPNLRRWLEAWGRA